MSYSQNAWRPSVSGRNRTNGRTNKPMPNQSERPPARSGCVGRRIDLLASVMGREPEDTARPRRFHNGPNWYHVEHRSEAIIRIVIAFIGLVMGASSIVCAAPAPADGPATRPAANPATADAQRSA